MRRFVLIAGLAGACLFATNALALNPGEGTITHVKLSSGALPTEGELRLGVALGLFDAEGVKGIFGVVGHFDAQGVHTSAEKDRHCVAIGDHAKLAEQISAHVASAPVRVYELGAPQIEKRGDAHWATFPSSLLDASEAKSFFGSDGGVGELGVVCASFDGARRVRAARIGFAEPKDGIRRVAVQSKD